MSTKRNSAAAVTICQAVAAFGLLVGAVSAQAVWQLDPSVEASTSYDDNVRLSTNDVEDAIVAEIAGELRLRQVTERSEISALVGGSYLSYLETDADLDNEDAIYMGADARRTFTTANVGIRGRYTRDLILRRLAPIPGVLSASATDIGTDTALLDQPLDDPLDDPLSQLDVETNATQNQVRRERWRIEPYMNWQFSERNSLNLAYSYYARNFEDGEQAGLRDTTDSRITFGVERLLTPRMTGGVLIGVSHFTAAGIGAQEDGEADNYTAEVSVDYLFNPRTRLSLKVGAAHAENDTSDLSETEGIWDVRFTRFMPASVVSLSWSRDTEPSVFGGLVRADRVVASYQQTLSQRWEFGVNAYAYRTQSVADAGTSRDNRKYFDIAPRITWRINRTWNLGALYRYRWTERNFDEAGLLAGSANGNVISLFVNFLPPRRI